MVKWHIMLTLPPDDFEHAKKHPEDFVVLSDMYGGRYIVRKSPNQNPSCLAVLLTVVLSVTCVYLFYLWINAE